MPVYAKKVSTNDSRWRGRANVIMAAGSISTIPVPDDVVLCNGCNANLVETDAQEGYLVYLGKRELDKDMPYDVYCQDCLTSYFPKHAVV